ncbi:MAG: spore coat protein [Christensenellales bacterium]
MTKPKENRRGQKIDRDKENRRKTDRNPCLFRTLFRNFVKTRRRKNDRDKTHARTNGKTAQSKSAQNKNRAACRSVAEAQRDCRLTDYDIISDILGSHKSLIKLYGTALCEIASEDLRDIVSCQMAECAEDQFDAFII